MLYSYTTKYKNSENILNPFSPITLNSSTLTSFKSFKLLNIRINIIFDYFVCLFGYVLISGRLSATLNIIHANQRKNQKRNKFKNGKWKTETK